MTRADLSEQLRAEGCNEIEIAEAWRDPHLRMLVARLSLRPRRAEPSFAVVVRRVPLHRFHPDMPTGWGFA